MDFESLNKAAVAQEAAKREEAERQGQVHRKEGKKFQEAFFKFLSPYAEKLAERALESKAKGNVKNGYRAIVDVTEFILQYPQTPYIQSHKGKHSGHPVYYFMRSYMDGGKLREALPQFYVRLATPKNESNLFRQRYTVELGVGFWEYDFL